MLKVNQSCQQDELCVKRVPGYEVVKIGTRPIPSDPDVCMCVCVCSQGVSKLGKQSKPISSKSHHYCGAVFESRNTSFLTILKQFYFRAWLKSNRLRGLSDRSG